MKTKNKERMKEEFEGQIPQIMKGYEIFMNMVHEAKVACDCKECIRWRADKSPEWLKGWSAGYREAGRRI